MSLVPTGDEPRFAEMRQVVELYVQNKQPGVIAKELGLRRVDVLNHIDEWKRTAVGSEVMKDRVEELIASMDEHYSLLIQKAHEVINEVDEEAYDPKGRSQMLGQKLAALRAAADFESKRIDVLQKSGLLDAADLGDELATMEEQKELILEILRNDLCDNCRPRIMGKIAAGMGGNTVVVVAPEANV